MKIGITLAFAAGLLLSLAACSSPNATDQFVGTWGSKDPGQPNLTVTQELDIMGTDGCNQMSGSGAVHGDTLRFENLASTEKACPDVDTWFSGAYGATVSGSVMTIVDMDDNTLGTLAQAPAQ